jgi:hypothetical protein
MKVATIPLADFEHQKKYLPICSCSFGGGLGVWSLVFSVCFLFLLSCIT